MTLNGKGKWQVRVVVLLIFVIGFIAGALSMNIYRDQRRWSSRMLPGGRFEEMTDKLNLTPEQRKQVDEIFDDTRAQVSELRKESGPKFRQVREQFDQRLREVLSPEQWDQFQKMVRESRGRRNHRPRREKQRE